MGSLALARRVGESVVITTPGGDRVVVTVAGFRPGGRVVLRVLAPDDVTIDRQEIDESKRREARR